LEKDGTDETFIPIQRSGNMISVKILLNLPQF
jgi:hypothetical protein